MKIVSDGIVHDVGMESLILVQNRPGTVGCLLKNSLTPQYKKPKLPFGGKSSKAHNCLQRLKLAHAFLLTNLVPTALFHDCIVELHVKYTAEQDENADLPLFECGRKWLQAGAQEAMCIHGIHARTADRQDWYLPCSPPHTETPWLPGLTFPFCVLDSLLFAAQAYNEQVQTLFDEDLLVIPYIFLDELYGLYPAVPLPAEAVIHEF